MNELHKYNVKEEKRSSLFYIRIILLALGFVVVSLVFQSEYNQLTGIAISSPKSTILFAIPVTIFLQLRRQYTGRVINPRCLLIDHGYLFTNEFYVVGLEGYASRIINKYITNSSVVITIKDASTKIEFMNKLYLHEGFATILSKNKISMIELNPAMYNTEISKIINHLKENGGSLVLIIDNKKYRFYKIIEFLAWTLFLVMVLVILRLVLEMFSITNFYPPILIAVSWASLSLILLFLVVGVYVNKTPQRLLIYRNFLIFNSRIIDLDSVVSIDYKEKEKLIVIVNEGLDQILITDIYDTDLDLIYTKLQQ